MPENNKPVAVVILNWNGAPLLRRYLPSVVANTNSDIADVIVADNGSTDQSLALLAVQFPSVRTIHLEENFGFAEGYNRAIAGLNHEFVVLLNSDVRVPSGWIEPLYDYMREHEQVGACQPKLLSDMRNMPTADGSDNAEQPRQEMFEYAGAAGGFLDCHGYPYCRGRIFSAVEPDNGQYDGDEPIEIFWATGAALMVRRNVYLQAGGLDSFFFAHMEEIDLCWRIHLLGYSIRCVTASRVYHLGGGSLPASNPRKTFLNFRNNLFLLYKNLPAKEGRRLLFVRRLYDTLSMLMFVLTFQWGNARAVYDAHMQYRKHYARYKGMQPQVNLLKTMPGTNRNIVIDYYLLGKRRY
ncbi:MAG: glycosyltransferase family 2 protein [Muribaculaceae bacterium]